MLEVRARVALVEQTEPAQSRPQVYHWGIERLELARRLELECRPRSIRTVRGLAVAGARGCGSTRRSTGRAARRFTPPVITISWGLPCSP